MQTPTMSQRRKKRHGVARVVENLARFPRRTATSLVRLWSADFELERRANWAVRRWFTYDRIAQLDAIAGMSAAHECRLLAYLAAQAPAAGAIVEIGAWKGKSTAWLVEGACRRSQPAEVFSIDPHERDSWEEFNNTVQRFDLARRGLTVQRLLSHDVGRTWNRPIGMLWIDGSHQYEAVRQDIDDFVPHVVPGGWVVFDDAAGGKFPGVERAIAERMQGRDGFRHVATIRHLDVFQRLPATGSASATPVDWQTESQLYDRPHPRLVMMARLLAGLPQRRLLDVGCATARLKQLLPPDFDYYGCDVTDHAAGVLAPDHFRQLDLNRSCDLSHFAGRGIDVVHIGGVLEYLERPEELLAACRRLVGPAGRLVLSIINFECQRYQQPERHHPGWLYKPAPDEFRRLLAASGWQIERGLPLLGKDRLRGVLLDVLGRILKLEHPIIRCQARQLVFQVRAVKTSGSLAKEVLEARLEV
jgi:SAM-dependent methyltransferase/predicted O-methyltransferase YrrM